jgi:hypothetical protein
MDPSLNDITVIIKQENNQIQLTSNYVADWLGCQLEAFISLK